MILIEGRRIEIILFIIRFFCPIISSPKINAINCDLGSQVPSSKNNMKKKSILHVDNRTNRIWKWFVNLFPTNILKIIQNARLQNRLQKHSFFS